MSVIRHLFPYYKRKIYVLLSLTAKKIAQDCTQWTIKWQCDSIWYDTDEGGDCADNYTCTCHLLLIPLLYADNASEVSAVWAVLHWQYLCIVLAPHLHYNGNTFLVNAFNASSKYCPLALAAYISNTTDGSPEVSISTLRLFMMKLYEEDPKLSQTPKNW